jgi:hypothetical protein
LKPAVRSDTLWNSALSSLSLALKPASDAFHSVIANSAHPPTSSPSDMISTIRVCSDQRRWPPRADIHSAASTEKPSPPSTISAMCTPCTNASRWNWISESVHSEKPALQNADTAWKRPAPQRLAASS